MQEKRLKRRFLPESLPSELALRPHNLKATFATGRTMPGESATTPTERVPLTSLMWSKVEQRLDVLVFRACFAPSVYAARHLVISGKVKLNGVKHSDPNTLLEPGSMFSVEPMAIEMLHNPNPVSLPYTTSPADGTPSSESSSNRKTSERAIRRRDRRRLTKASREAARKALKEAASRGPLSFTLPPFAAPSIFIPAYLEVSFASCSAVYVRHPSARPGVSEIPTPYDADGEVMAYTWEWYLRNNRRLSRRLKPGNVYKREFKRAGYHGHGGALVTEHFAKLRQEKGVSPEEAIRLVRERQESVMAAARETALKKLPPHLKQKLGTEVRP